MLRIFQLDKKILHIGLGIEDEVIEVLRLEHSFAWCWNWDASGRNTWKVLKCGARRRIEKISWTDHVRNEKYYLESMSRGISHMK